MIVRQDGFSKQSLGDGCGEEVRRPLEFRLRMQRTTPGEYRHLRGCVEDVSCKGKLGFVGSLVPFEPPFGRVTWKVAGRALCRRLFLHVAGYR